LLLAKLTGFSPFTPILFASVVGFSLHPGIPLLPHNSLLNDLRHQSYSSVGAHLRATLETPNCV
jgi:hypothetical protein